MIMFGMIPQCAENLTFGKDTNILKTDKSYNIYLAILNIKENKTNVKQTGTQNITCEKTSQNQKFWF